MILVDAGNTRVHFAFVDKNEIVRRTYLNTKDANASSVRAMLGRFPHEHVLVCSVVPRITRYFALKKQIGQDRLLLAFGAKELYPKSRIIIDFGTAITFDFLSAKGEYLGGFIFPGIDLSAKALSECALLPQITLNTTNMKRKYSIARNTRESISRGVYEGVIAMMNSWMDSYAPRLIRQKQVHKGQIVLTGGCAGSIRSKFTFPNRYDPDLIFRGMTRLFRLIR